MKRLTLVFGGLIPLAFSPFLQAESDSTVSAAVQKSPDHYRVRIYQENGDCLWRIAEKVYGDRSKWRLIYLANRDIIHDPNKIYPRMKLKIPPPDWQPDAPDGH